MFTEMRQMIARAKIRFLKEALPLAITDVDLKLVQSIAAAVGDISPEEGMAAMRREMASRNRA